MFSSRAASARVQDQVPKISATIFRLPRAKFHYDP
jgi:hypothetical protein